MNWTGLNDVIHGNDTDYQVPGSEQIGADTSSGISELFLIASASYVRKPRGSLSLAPTIGTIHTGRPV